MFRCTACRQCAWDSSPNSLVQSSWSHGKSCLPSIAACIECPIMSIPAGTAIANCTCHTASLRFSLSRATSLLSVVPESVSVSVSASETVSFFHFFNRRSQFNLEQRVFQVFVRPAGGNPTLQARCRPSVPLLHPRRMAGGIRSCGFSVTFLDGFALCSSSFRARGTCAISLGCAEGL